jgi:hypothetical protein
VATGRDSHEPDATDAEVGGRSQRRESVGLWRETSPANRPPIVNGSMATHSLDLSCLSKLRRESTFPHE